MEINKRLIIVFVRNPELGKVKTRLAKSIGPYKTLEIYKELLNHTCNVLKESNYDCAVFYADKIISNDIWNDNKFKKYQQTGNDLGERMLNAFKSGFKKNYAQIIIIGSDLPDINQSVINQAFENLTQNNYVFGPSEDGGYYLLGMNSINPTLFKNKKWSTNSVLSDTLNDLKYEKVALLKTLNDIDTYEDLKQSKYKDML